LQTNTQSGNSHIYMHPLQKKIFKEMSPAKKLELSAQLYYSARELKAAALRQQHPSWSEEKVNKKVREIFLYARS